jgi:hypothetical protein
MSVGSENPARLNPAGTTDRLAPSSSSEDKDDQCADATRHSGPAPGRTQEAEVATLTRVAKREVPRLEQESPVGNAHSTTEPQRREIDRSSKLEPLRIGWMARCTSSPRPESFSTARPPSRSSSSRGGRQDDPESGHPAIRNGHFRIAS